MIVRKQFLCTYALAALAVLVCCTGAADANWVTIRNNTRQTIVVQETVMVNGQPKRSKPASLLPGESLREFVPGPTIKKIELFDGQNGNPPLWSGNLNCKDENQTYSITSTGGKIVLHAVQSPVAPKK